MNECSSINNNYDTLQGHFTKAWLRGRQESIKTKAGLLSTAIMCSPDIGTAAHTDVCSAAGAHGCTHVQASDCACTQTS